jgi:hypothetical protein
MYIVYKEDPVVKACGKELGGCAAQWGYQRIYRVSKGNVWTQWDYDGTQWDYDGTQWDYDGTIPLNPTAILKKSSYNFSEKATVFHHKNSKTPPFLYRFATISPPICHRVVAALPRYSHNPIDKTKTPLYNILYTLSR